MEEEETKKEEEVVETPVDEGGAVCQLANKIKDMSNRELFDRFNHITRAQAIREYLATKEDLILKIEVNLAGQEIYERMSITHNIAI